MIKINQVNKYYNKKKTNEIHVLNNISLELPDTGMVAIFGRSGCGKTTLLNVIGGLDSFNDGTITIDNENIRNNTDVLRNREIGYIFQNYNLNNKETCYENVASALRLCGMEDKDEIDKRVIAALDNVDMTKYRMRLPNTLSGGQMQRIAIARAIVKNPRIILADEPTGNLDEHNTIMIMDLLREISKTHLVILVTHEANLVNLYCDKIIALSDGEVIDERDNEILNSYVARDKNNIYLGELDKKEEKNDYINLEYYGKEPSKPVDIQIVNYNGKMYLKLNTPKVQLLDENSEVKLQEGEFHTEGVKKEKELKMRDIPAFNGKNYGRLFNLKNSITSGFKENFVGKKFGNTLLKIVLLLLAFILVMLTARFGVSIRSVLENEDKYDRNIFYVYTPDKEHSTILENARADPNTGISFTRLVNYSEIDGKVQKFSLGKFESYMGTSSGVSATVVRMSLDAIGNKKVVAGTTSDLVSGEIVITSRIADMIIDNFGAGYVEKYRDVIGFVASNGGYSGILDYDYYYEFNTSYRVVGIVESNECEIFMLDYDLAKEFVNNNAVACRVYPASDYNYILNDDETIYVKSYDREGIAVGNQILINGKYYTIKQIVDGSDMDYQMSDRFVISDLEFASVYKAYKGYDQSIEYIGDYFYTKYYTMVYSTDIKKTEEFLKSKFNDVEINDVGVYDDFKIIYTPDMMREKVSESSKSSIRANLITLLIFIILLSLCMYFIMHSMMISRIKEIGIYRAIGVKKSNLIFKFFIETLVLTTLTVFVGFLLASGLLGAWSLKAGALKEVLYYPVWMALIVAVFLYGISTICGLIPIVILLIRTPSQILSKYDI